jgi:hypothetical protein
MVTAVNGGKITCDAGGLLLGAADQAVGLIDRVGGVLATAGWKS